MAIGWTVSKLNVFQMLMKAQKELINVVACVAALRVKAVFHFKRNVP
jgi:hypothetical protein